MGCGKKAAAEDAEQEKWERDLALIKTVRTESILKKAQELEGQIRELKERNLALTRDQHWTIDRILKLSIEIQGRPVNEA